MIPLSAEKDASLDKKNDKNRKYPVAGRDSIVKAQIIQTAFDLFAQYGIKSISMDMIAHSIGISKRTVYEYFNDKETLLIEGINFYKEKIRNAAEKAFRTNDSVLKAILFFYKELLRNPRWYSPKFFDDLKKFPLATDQMNELRNNFSKGCSLLYQKGVDSGIFIKDLNFEIIALLAKSRSSCNNRPTSSRNILQ